MDPSASSLGKHFAWKERLEKERASVYRSMEKWVSMGMIRNLPIKDDEKFWLTPTSRKDPYKLLRKLRDASPDDFATQDQNISPSPTGDNDGPVEPNGQNSMGNRRYSCEDFTTMGTQKRIVLPIIKTRMSSGEKVTPYSEFLVGAQSKVNKEAPMLMFKSSMEIYKPQKKQYVGQEKRGYMIGAVNLKQSSYTYCKLPKAENQTIKFMPHKPDASEFYYNRKKAAFLIKPFDKSKMVKSSYASVESPLKTADATKTSINENVNNSNIQIKGGAKYLEKVKINATTEILARETLDAQNLTQPESPIIPASVIKNSARSKNKFRVSKNGMYTTTMVSSNLDLKDLRVEAKRRIRQRKSKQL